MRAVLEWALVDSEIHRAAEFVGVATSARPVGVCPCCREGIVWKAGDVKVPHVAHQPESTCAATNPETAAHLNAKAALVRALSAVDALAISGRCSDRHDVVGSWPIPRWVHVVPEYRLGTRRPDVSLLGVDLAGVAAVEVFHTHAVDVAKAADLAVSGLPWVEVLSDVASAWEGTSPLTIYAADAGTQVALDAACVPCSARRTAADEARQRAAVELARAKREAAVVHAHSVQRRNRAEVLPQLVANPPTLHIAVAVAMVGNPGFAAVGAVVMRRGKTAHTLRILEQIGSGEASWYAIEFALDLVKGHVPGRAATIHTSYVSTAKSANECVGDSNDLRRRVCAAVARTGSLVVAAIASRPADAAAVRWIAVAKEAARRRMVEMALDGDLPDRDDR